MKQAFLAATLMISTYAGACINDRDTLAFELRNVDAIKRIRQETDYRKKGDAAHEIALRAIGGRFERFPAKYYEMRVARLEALSTLSANEYDDLAVAYERLGNTDKAIGILLESKPHRKSKDDSYRFHANYGTFLVHKWLAQKDRTDKKALKQSIAEIEAALKINPDSHFGRENVQLELERLWLTGKAVEIEDSVDLIVGLAGIAMMGLGYELPDAYYLMTDLHLGADTSIMDSLALSRAKELVTEGKAFVSQKLDSKEVSKDFGPEVGKAYKELRVDGQTVHHARLAYINSRLERGEHPDTHADFWNEWQEPAFPVLKRIPDEALENMRRSTVSFALVLVGVVVASVFVIVLVRRSKRRG